MNIDKFFNDDPWEKITSPEYPNGRYLYQKDQRFFASMDASNQIIFFAKWKNSNLNWGNIKVKSK